MQIEEMNVQLNWYVNFSSASVIAHAIFNELQMLIMAYILQRHRFVWRIFRT